MLWMIVNLLVTLLAGAAVALHALAGRWIG